MAPFELIVVTLLLSQASPVFSLDIIYEPHGQPTQPAPTEKNCDRILEEATYRNQTLHKLMFEVQCMPKGWEPLFKEMEQEIKAISDQLKVDAEKYNGELNPKLGWIFRAFHEVPLDKLKAVILGQDPAPQPGLATGLAFSLHPSVKPYKVPSVQRVILEARNEGYCVDPQNGNLQGWADQGVLLLNTALTLVPKSIGSHLSLWRDFSKKAIKFINEHAKPTVWILWGNKAKYFKKYINTNKHYVVKGGHPSPRAKPIYFFCQNYFTCANKWLCKKGRGMIEWGLAGLPCKKHESRLYGRLGSFPGYTEKESCEMQPCP